MDLKLNGQLRSIDDAQVDPSMPLLWVLRDVLGLRGTKFGCGVAACGACTVHLDGQAARSCVTPLAAVQGRAVRTIEALGGDTREGSLHPLQRAWLEHQVPQCGYCQSGMLMAAAALLTRNPDPSDAEIDAAMTNLCRCGSYPRVRTAIRAVAVASRKPAARPRAGNKPA
jgi:isoquinoline 1-oxidoreductase alpha subunit